MEKSLYISSFYNTLEPTTTPRSVTLILFFPNPDAQFELQQVLLTMSKPAELLSGDWMNYIS